MINGKLPNGIRYHLFPREGSPVVAVQCWIAVGTTHERDDEWGMAHFMEHMLFRSSPGQESPHERIEAMGGELGAQTTHDWTQLYAVVPQDRWKEVLLLLADVLRFDGVSEAELEAEKRVVLEEMRLSQGSPIRRVTQGLLRTTFGEHPYGRAVIGTPSSVAGYGSEGVERFYREAYGCQGWTFTFCGDVPLPAVEEEMRSVFGVVVPGGELSPSRGWVRPTTTFWTEPHPGLPSCLMALGYPLADMGLEDRVGLDLVSSVLGQGTQSRIGALSLREDSPVLGGAVSVFKGREHGVLTLLLQSRLGAEREAIEAVCSEVEALAKNLGEEEVEGAKRLFDADRAYASESSHQWLSALSQRLLEGRNYESLEEIEGVNGDSLRSFLSRFVCPGNRVLALISPEGAFPLNLDDLLPARKDENEVYRVAQPREFVRSSLSPVEESSGGRRGTPGSEYKGPEDFELNDGTRVVVDHRPSGRVEGMVALFPGGIAIESEGAKGVTRLVSEVLANAVSSNGDSFCKRLEAQGGGLFGFARLESLGLQGLCHGNGIRDGLESFVEALRGWNFSEEQFESFRSREIESALNLPLDGAEEALEQFRRSAFGESHPYARASLGTVESLEGLAAESAREFLRRHVLSSQRVLAFVGPLTRKDVEEALLRLPEAVVPIPPLPPEPLKHTPSTLYKEASGLEHTFVVGGFRTVNYGSPDRLVFQVIATLLSSLSGPLSMELREKMGAVYALRAETSAGAYPGAIWVETATRVDWETRVIHGIREGLLSFAQWVTPEHVERAKSLLRGRTFMSHESALTRALSVTRQAQYGGSSLHTSEEAELFQEVTVERIQEVCAEYFRPEYFSLGVARPLE